MKIAKNSYINLWKLLLNHENYYNSEIAATELIHLPMTIRNKID